MSDNLKSDAESYDTLSYNNIADHQISRTFFSTRSSDFVHILSMLLYYMGSCIFSEATFYLIFMITGEIWVKCWQEEEIQIILDQLFT